MANRWDTLAIAYVLAGAIVRIVWGLSIHPPFDYLYSDMGAYLERAQRLATGAGLVRAGLWAAAVLWCALSASIPFFAWRLALLLLTPSAADLCGLEDPRRKRAK